MQNDDASRRPSLIESVDHALRLILLLENHAELRVSSVAEELGVARSTAHRLLSTLAGRGFVTQDRVTRAYRAGRVLAEFGLRPFHEVDFRRKALPHVKALADETRETVNLLVRDADGMRFIGGVESTQPVRTGVLTGTVLPAYATSGGKVMIADHTLEELRRMYPQGLKRLTDKTPANLNELVDELGLVRSQGYAINFEGSALGLRAVAVPIRDHTNHTVAALCLSAPSQRLPRAKLPATVNALRSTAVLIQADLYRTSTG